MIKWVTKMSVAEYFKKYNNADVIFDPSPSYNGIWHFSVNPLIDLSLVEKEVNLFQEFLNETYYKPLKNIFETDLIYKFKVSMISSPNEDKVGRSLKYSKYSFFEGLLHFIDQKVDRVGLSDEEQLNNLLDLAKLVDKDTDTRNFAFINVLKEKQNRLLNIKENQLNSIYFEAAMEQYELLNINISFTDYINNLYNDVLKLQKGLIHLDDFFDKKIDYQKIYECFEPDKFYLLFAKIIYDFNIKYEKKKGTLNTSSQYLCLFNSALEIISQENKHYNPEIFYKSISNTKIRVSRYEIEYRIKEMFDKHPEMISELLPQEIININKYKDIDLVSKITRIDKNNWQLVKNIDDLKGSSQDISERLRVLNNTESLMGAFLGLNSFKDYSAFVYSNEKVIIESLNNECATYIISMDDFIILNDINNLPKDNIKRLFHTSINNWQRNIYNEIKGTYLVKDALNFINGLPDVNIDISDFYSSLLKFISVEREAFNTLVSTDNVLGSNVTAEDIINYLEFSFEEKTLNAPLIGNVIITEGDIISILKILYDIMNYEGKYVIYINEDNAGTITYLVSRANKLYKQYNLNLELDIDYDKNYNKYLDELVTIVGSYKFVSETSKDLKKANKIAM